MGIHSTRELVCNAHVKRLIQFKARQLSRRGGFCSSDEDDLAQEIWLYLLRQAHRFDPDRASLPTFINRVVNSAAAMLVRRRRRINHISRFQTVSLESTMLEVEGVPTSARKAISEEHLHRRTGGASSGSALLSDERLIIDRAIRSLSPQLRDIFCRLMGSSANSVARDMAISRRQVRKAVRTIRRRLQRARIGNFQEKRTPRQETA
jgi:RNA polymerase sigma factor (sigma-70 family)